MKKTKSVFGLVCAGGGAHGAYQVGVLKYIHEKFSNAAQSPFQIFAGSSCGALNTTFFGAQSFDGHASRLWLEEMWLDFHVPAYHGNILKNSLVSIFKEWRKPSEQRDGVWALLDPRPMMKIIHGGFKRKNLDRSFREGSTRGVAISATELLSGRACWFQEGPQVKPWNLFHSLGIVEPLSPLHVAASCSVPIFLPPVKIGNHYFLDGSVSLDKPLSAAIIMGANKIVSIATDKPFPTGLPSYHPEFHPHLSNVIRLLLNRLSHDAAGDEATELQMLNRFYQALSQKARAEGNNGSPHPLFHEEALPSDYQPIEVLRISPSKRIRHSHGIIDEDSPPAARQQTRFMFHERFIRELIELGYADARLRHEDLKNFFLQPARRRWPFFVRQLNKKSA